MWQKAHGPSSHESRLQMPARAPASCALLHRCIKGGERDVIPILVTVIELKFLLGRGGDSLHPPGFLFSMGIIVH